MDPHLRGAQADPVDEREGLLPGQRGRGGVLRASQAGVLPRARLRRRHHQGVHRTTGRVHDLVPGREDQTHFRHQHRQTKTRARTHGIIKEQGHRSPTKRHHPHSAPWNPRPTTTRSAMYSMTSHRIASSSLGTLYPKLTIRTSNPYSTMWVYMGEQLRSCSYTALMHGMTDPTYISRSQS